MSPRMISHDVSINTVGSKRRWTGYVTALFFTAAGLIVLLWAIGQGALSAVSVQEPPDNTSVITLMLEGTAGLLASVFGFAMLVQATPSVETESLSVWALPEQRTFEDETPSTLSSE